MSNTSTMSDRFAAVLRTVVPSLWGSVLGFLVQHQVLTADQALNATPLGVQLAELVVIPAAIGVYYVAVRWLERQQWMPRWIVRILIGSAKQLAYSTTPS
jgi:hypothetical protein